MMFFGSETTIKIQLGSIQEKLNQRQRQERIFEANVIPDECEDEKCGSTQFLQMEKNQLFDLQEHLERYCNISPVSAVNSAKHDINLVKSYLLPILINERKIEPTVIKKANHFISSKFGDIRFLHIMNFLLGATSLGSFLKAYKTSETESYISYNSVDNTENCRIHNSLRMIFSSVNCAVASHLKQKTQST